LVWDKEQGMKVLTFTPKYFYSAIVNCTSLENPELLINIINRLTNGYVCTFMHDIITRYSNFYSVYDYVAENYLTDIKGNNVYHAYSIEKKIQEFIKSTNTHISSVFLISTEDFFYNSDCELFSKETKGLFKEEFLDLIYQVLLFYKQNVTLDDVFNIVEALEYIVLEVVDMVFNVLDLDFDNELIFTEVLLGFNVIQDTLFVMTKVLK